MPIVAELNVRADVAAPPLANDKLVWLREAVMPAGVDRASETGPEKLLRLVRVMVDVPVEGLMRTVWDGGLAETE